MAGKDGQAAAVTLGQSAGSAGSCSAADEASIAQGGIADAFHRVKARKIAAIEKGMFSLRGCAASIALADDDDHQVVLQCKT